MIPISKKRDKRKGSCIQVKGERGKVGSGGPHQHPPRSVWESPANINFVLRHTKCSLMLFVMAVAMPHWLPQGRAFL